MRAAYRAAPIMLRRCDVKGLRVGEPVWRCARRGCGSLLRGVHDAPCGDCEWPG